MTKKKRELIEILLDNVKPEDWPESLPYAAQDKSCSMVYVYANIPDISSIYADRWECGAFSFKGINIQVELCRYWNKTIVHRDEFMKRWNERNRVFVSITDQSPATMDSAKYEALEFTDIGGDVEKTLTFSREGIAPVTLTEKMEKISITPNVDSEGWIKWNGGEMPVEKGTLIDVKYRRGLVNLHVKAGENPSGGSIPRRYAIDFKHDNNKGDIIAYRLHVPQEQKTPQQLALEKFGTDWHDNDGSCPVCDDVIIEVMHENGVKSDQQDKASEWLWGQLTGGWTISKWRVHSETDTTTPPALKESHAEETKPIQQEVKASDTQVGGDHYTKLAIQPMRYSMENGLDALQHTVIKYVTRFRDKAGIEDLEKAKHCIDMLIEYERGKK